MAPSLLQSAVAGGAAVISLTAAAYFYRRSLCSGGRRRAVGIIPARFQSSRFEGKPLAHILGKPMIQRTWEQAVQATALEAVVVATDDERIADCCRGFGATVVMTSQSCENGTVRCSEALGKLKTKYNIVVNIQGDEPLIDPAIIDGVVLALQRAPDAVYSTAVTALKPEDALDTNRVKCVTDQNGYAIYFSRGLVPHNKKGTVNTRFPYLLHLGIQCYDAKFLAVYANMKPTPLQLQEDLEQLKVLENGYKMKVIKVDHDAHGVDTPEDLAKVEALMQSHHIL
ncbi:unnamed protein product [Sphagnum jensenii]|uniref:3-deoxy-manno-octulosonate cytidylyltransferase n=1 Tax=Sphagnum jensenii TaxID=128206 RepID=A0ABP0XAN0_9BRYO